MPRYVLKDKLHLWEPAQAVTVLTSATILAKLCSESGDKSFFWRSVISSKGAF